MKDAKTCWEYLNCPDDTKKKCIVYKTNSGSECWFMSDVENGCLGAKEKGGCFNCPWFKKNNPKLVKSKHRS